jgi:hypothetical protein
MIVEGLRQNRCCGSFSNRTVCAKHSNPGASDISNASREHSEILFRPGHTHISDEHTGSVCGRNELRIFSEELMEPTHDMEATGNGVKNHVALGIRKKATGWSQSNNEDARVAVTMCECFVEIANDTDAIGHSIKNHPGIAFATRAVDYRSDDIGFTLTDKPVCRLPINLSEVSFAIHNRDRSNRNVANAILSLGGGRRRHDNPFVMPQGDEENVSTKTTIDCQKRSPHKKRVSALRVPILYRKRRIS